MRDLETLKLMNTECVRDSKGNHYWEKIGVTYSREIVLVLVWRCSQCHYVVEEPLTRLSDSKKIINEVRAED